SRTLLGEGLGSLRLADLRSILRDHAGLAAAAEADVGAASRIADTLGALEQELETALADALPSLRGDDTGAQATEFMGGIAARVDTRARALLATLDARHG
ncbi:MAG: hypothetical protein ACKO2K_07590, partial [Alphaproteobacteria bacterium]